MNHDAFRSVVRVEMKKKTDEYIQKTKTHSYSRGGYKSEETILRITTETAFALLDCGHWRKEHNVGVNISKAKKLKCWVCHGVLPEDYYKA